MTYTFRAEQPQPGGPPQPAPSPNPAPWHDPGPPVREVPLPPDQPSPGVPVENPERSPGTR